MSVTPVDLVPHWTGAPGVDAVALDPAGLDAGATLLLAEQTLRQRRAAEALDLRLAAHWADLHADDPREWPAERQFRGMARLVQVGGPGTPPMQDLAIAELAISRQVHPLAARALIADALDLRHRLPGCWGIVLRGDSEVWVARKVAQICRRSELTAAEAAVVDEAVADVLASEQPSRVLTVAEAKAIEANPQRHAARTAADRAKRFVSLGRVDEAGLRHVIARVEAGDAVWVDAMVDHVADLLARDDDAARREARSRDQLRAEAFGWLARPAELLALLLRHQGAAESDPADDEECRSRATAFPADLLDALREVDPARLRPQVTLYVHLHEAAISGLTHGVARVEGMGPRLLSDVAHLVRHAHVEVRPVIDLRDHVSVNCYEHPTALRERISLLTPGDVFPHGVTIGRRLDLDHVIPFRAGGEPAQTGVHNAAPLTRTHHRAKTHAGYQVRRTGPGEYVWRTPHHRYRLVDHHGTHPIDGALACALTGPSEVERALTRAILGWRRR